MQKLFLVSSGTAVVKWAL